MKIRWRQQEFYLVTFIAIVTLVYYKWNFLSFDAAAAQVPENTRTQMLLLQALPLLLQYGVYCWLAWLTRFVLKPSGRAGTFRITRAIEPALIRQLGRKSFRFTWILLSLLAAVYILGPVINYIQFYFHENQYPEYFHFFPKHPQPFFNRFGGYNIMAFYVFIYLVYVMVREIMIHYLQRDRPTRGYEIIIANQVIGSVALILGGAFFLTLFDFIQQRIFLAIYIVFTLSALALFIFCVHWMFPRIKGRSLLQTGTILRLFLAIDIASLPFIVVIWGETGKVQAIGIIYFVWLLLIVLVLIPLSWLYYQQQKTRLTELRDMRKDLVRSSTNLQALRAQINPHFLFNALNTLYGTALRENAPDAAAGIQKLGDMMRIMLHENSLDLIPMSRELEYLNNYIALQQLRIQGIGNIAVKIELPEKNCDLQIAPMLLIPFIENAFKHGISFTEPSWINIKMTCEGDWIRLDVRNSMHPKRAYDPEDVRSGIGLKNVVERLKLLYPAKFELAKSEEKGEYAIRFSVVGVRSNELK